MSNFVDYMADMGKILYYYPYQAYLDTSIEIVRPYELEEIIPACIQQMITSMDFKNPCPYDGIKPRYLEIFDTRSNRYIVECPKPFLLLPTLESELNNNFKVKGWLGHGEKVFYRKLINL